MPRTLKDEIVERVERLGPPEQRKVLDFVRGMGVPAGTAGKELLSFAGAIEPQDLDAISQAIQEGCETIEPNGW
jgi:hypothetical protein